jgi:hypothetical protein
MQDEESCVEFDSTRFTGKKGLKTSFQRPRIRLADKKGKKKKGEPRNENKFPHHTAKEWISNSSRGSQGCHVVVPKKPRRSGDNKYSVSTLVGGCIRFLLACSAFMNRLFLDPM